MFTDENVISITDIRQNATSCIDKLPQTGDKIIFKNNKPQAALVDFQRYKKMLEKINSDIEPLYGSEELV